MAEGEVDFEAHLAANRRAGNMAPAENSEGYSHAAVELVLAARETLELIFAQSIVVIDSGVGLHAKRDTRAEIVNQR